MNIKNSEDPLSTHFFKIRLKAQPGFTRVKPMGKPGERWALRTLAVSWENQCLHMRKQRRRSALQELSSWISTFVFTTWILQFLYFLNPKFPASSHLLYLYILVCVGPVREPHCWFSHDAGHYLDWAMTIQTLLLEWIANHKLNYRATENGRDIKWSFEFKYILC